MKINNTKYDLGDEVFVLNSKFIKQTTVENIRINIVKPYTELKINNKKTSLVERDGITIEYLVEVSREQPLGCNGVQSYYDWYKEEDVFNNKEELIRQII